MSGAEDLALLDGARIVFVLPSLAVGGAEAQLASVLETDPEIVRRMRLTVLTLSAPHGSVVEGRVHALGVDVRTIDRSSMGFAAFLWQLVRFFRAERPDLVHCFLAGSSGTWGRLAARLAGVERVMFSDRTLYPRVTRVHRLLDPLAIRLTSQFVSNAEATAQRLVAQGVPRDRIEVIRNGVDLSRFDPDRAADPRDAWKIGPDAVVAGFLGMFRSTKRPDLLIDAVLALPPASRPDYLVMGGDGERMPEIAARVEADPWLRERCRLLGVVADTPAFHRGIDYLVLSSDTEGMPNVILEAMAMGRPCIATKVSDVPFLVTDNGFLVDPGDVAGLADALRRMQELGSEERRAMGERGRRRAVEEFGLERATRRFWAIHAALLGAGA